MEHRVIFITDGDAIARETVEYVAQKIGGRCISASAGNPTQLTGEQLFDKIKQAVRSPVLMMFDDSGHRGAGEGEQAMAYLSSQPDIHVLGVVAVASNTSYVKGVFADYCIDYQGRRVRNTVDKEGRVVEGTQPIVYGDTVDIFSTLRLPIIIGIGDIGKMGECDCVRLGAPITTMAVNDILQIGPFLLS